MWHCCPLLLITSLLVYLCLSIYDTVDVRSCLLILLFIYLLLWPHDMWYQVKQNFQKVRICSKVENISCGMLAVIGVYFWNSFILSKTNYDKLPITRSWSVNTVLFFFRYCSHVLLCLLAADMIMYTSAMSHYRLGECSSMLDTLVGLMPFSSAPTNVVSPKTLSQSPNY